MGFNVTTERLRGRELKCENMLTFGAYLFTTSVSKLSAMPLLLKARLEIYSSAPGGVRTTIARHHGRYSNLIICVKMAWSEHLHCGVNIR